MGEISVLIVSFLYPMMALRARQEEGAGKPRFARRLYCRYGILSIWRPFITNKARMCAEPGY